MEPRSSAMKRKSVKPSNTSGAMLTSLSLGLSAIPMICNVLVGAIPSNSLLCNVVRPMPFMRRVFRSSPLKMPSGSTGTVFPPPKVMYSASR